MKNEQLPAGWEWSTIGAEASINPRLTRKDIPDILRVSFLPMKQVEEVSGKYSLSEERGYGEVRKGFTAFQDGDVIFAKITPCMENGKIAVMEGLTNSIGFGSTEFHVFRCHEKLVNKYLFYFLVQTQFRREAEGNMTGAVGQRRVPKGFLEIAPIPLPPLRTQQQIVTKIEELFSEIDAGVTELQTALARLKTYRQAVLHHYLSNDKWEKVKIKDIASMCLGKMLDKTKNKGSLQPYLRNINVRWGYIDFSDVLEMRFEKSEEERYGLEEGDVLVCEGGEPGRAAIWKSESTGMKIQKAIHRVRLSEKMQSNFFYYFMRLSADNNYLSQFFTGTTIKHLTGKEFGKMQVPLPDLDTQNQIVAEIEARLSEADALEATIRQELTRAENLRQSILKQAFAGTLVTEETTYPAISSNVPEAAAVAEPIGQGTGQLNLF